jgi:nucleoside 2-deoxyribosyltransferase
VKVYVASSWRNKYQQDVVAELRNAGHEVYDFRNPRPGDHGFHWSEIDPKWQQWREFEYRDALKHPIAESGFASDFEAMQWADACVLVLPCGRSAHLEAGWFVGQGKPCAIFIPETVEPELMYKMGTVCVWMDEVLECLATGDRNAA